jgi:hypothetical protein
MRYGWSVDKKFRVRCTSVQCTSLIKSRKIRNAFLANSASVIGGAIISVVYRCMYGIGLILIMHVAGAGDEFIAYRGFL